MSEKPPEINFDTNPPVQVIQYDNLITKFVPGYEALFQMALAYLRTVLASKASVLVVGAGTGKELVSFGQAVPDWSLIGVDPSAHMLTIARQKVAQYSLTEQVTLHEGFVEDLPGSREFEAATCFLVMHFLPDNGAKLALLSSIASRLKPGGSLLLVDVYGGSDFVKEFGPTWIRHGYGMGVPLEEMEKLEKAHVNFHPISEARTLELLDHAGFEQVQRFYTALIYSGWIGIRKAS